MPLHIVLPEGIESMCNACNTAFFSIMVCYNVISKSCFLSFFFLSDLFIILFVAGLGTD